MRTGLVLLATVLAAALAATHSAAQTVHVPADFSTIQAAIQSGATLVYVAEGTYPESLIIESSVTLLPEPPADPMAALPFPRVWGMAVGRGAPPNPVVYVRGFHFTGPVRHINKDTNPGRTILEGCRLDAGFQTTGSSSVGETIHLRSCTITGDVFLYAYGADFTNNTVRRGSARIHSNGLGAIVRDNVVLGPGEHGLMSTSADSPGSMTGNFVSGVTTGYELRSGTASGNTAEDCERGFAPFSVTHNPGQPRFRQNTARRCGVGFDMTDNLTAEVTGNLVDSSRTVGIHVGPGVVGLVQDNTVTASGSHGIWIESYLPPTGNTVLFSGGDGIVSPETPEWNVVGRSAGRGIVAPLARHNTVYLNGGAGLQLSGSGGATDTVSHNIAHANGGYGLVWTGTGSPALACNDWYGNSSGATSGVATGATDLSVHPYFCELPADDARLSSGSPLLAFTACGPIGALGVGCSGTTSAGGDAPPAARLSANPNPTRGVTELRWTGGGAPCRIEVFDLTGALRLRAELPAGARSWRWNGNDGESRALPGGTYWVRRTEGLVREHARVTLMR